MFFNAPYLIAKTTDSCVTVKDLTSGMFIEILWIYNVFLKIQEIKEDL
ncbi:hypothetical protein MCHI_000419 [Candidatus Magnetoovum chiemensis]|nr:hypothetical protein MCHI_000419 [Candidatus Magnetoovum chiemensis]